MADDERRAEIEAGPYGTDVPEEAWAAFWSVLHERKTTVGPTANYYAGKSIALALQAVLDRVRRAPGPSSQDTETDAHLVAERAIDAYLAAIPSSRERDAGIKAVARIIRDELPYAVKNSTATRIAERVIAALTSSRERDAGTEEQDGLWRTMAREGAHAQLDVESDLAAARARIEHLTSREAHFARVLGVSDGGQYRNDWDSAIRRLIDRAEAGETRCEEIRAETIAAFRDKLIAFGYGQPWVDWLVRDIERHFAAPPARNDEHGTENEG